MESTSFFVDGAEIRLEDGRTIITCLLDLCPDREGTDCRQNCPMLSIREVRRLIAERPQALMAAFLRQELFPNGFQPA